MHDTVLTFYGQYFPLGTQTDKSVLEVGSKLEGGGTLRTVFNDVTNYVGLDMLPGAGVDVVTKMEEWDDPRQFDVVCSAGTLEHCEDWRGVVNGMKKYCKEGGTVCITTVAKPFHRHNYPNDYWRFTKPIFDAAFADWEIVTSEQHPNADVFIVAKKLPTSGTIDLTPLIPDNVD